MRLPADADQVAHLREGFRLAGVPD
jgi:hypothetical protein